MKNLQQEIVEIRKTYNINIPDAKDLNEESLVHLCELGMLQIDEKNGNTIFFNIAISIMEMWLQENFTTFKETEGLYKWCKSICIARNNAMNEWRAFGFGYKTFKEWYQNKNKK